ncbi:hypothetical protein AAY473_008279 [Plecturocebus cupreus]
MALAKSKHFHGCLNCPLRQREIDLCFHPTYSATGLSRSLVKCHPVTDTPCRPLWIPGDRFDLIQFP